MAKDKQFEAEYKAEGKRRALLRNKKRTSKYIERCIKKQFLAENNICPICMEGEYCYCGSNTPGVIDY